MKLLILGATGVVGAWTVRKAIEHGHDITLHVRDKNRVPEDITSSTKVQKIVQGTLTDEETLSDAIRDQDAILSAIGPSSLNFTAYRGQFIAGYSLILRLMRQYNVRRILAMGTISTYTDKDSPSWVRSFAYWLVFCLVRPIQKEILGMEKVFREEGEGLDWTFYRVGRLGNSQEDGGMAEAGWVGDGRWRNFVERRDWANWLLQEAEREQPMWVHEMPAIYTPLKK